MIDSVEYQFYIGCKDSSLHDVVVNKESLIEMVERFFISKEEMTCPENILFSKEYMKI